MTDDTEIAEVEAAAPDAETDAAVEAPVEEAAPEAPAAEKRFPKVVKRAEEEGITHYSPKAHEELDPSSRFTD